ncbi:MAG TPA: hypothetical protein VJP78_15110, partial [Thermoleophilia bacterium]|nr:hypothetical protein [Thermoleophilia bacterium]
AAEAEERGGSALAAPPPPAPASAAATTAAEARPPLDVVVQDLRVLLERAAEDLGDERAARWSRKLLGWYLRPVGVSSLEVEDLRKLPDVTALDTALDTLVERRSPA